MMKSVSTIVASVMCALLFLPGCDGSRSLKDEYEVRSTELSLSAAGGEQTVKVLNREGKPFGKAWSLFNVTIPDTLNKCGTTKFVDDEALRIDTLADALVVLREIGIPLRSPRIVGRCRCCLLYTSPSPRDTERSRMPSSA